MLIWHILVLALALVALTWLHLRLVRRHGIAPPIDEGPR
jgi:ubiquinol-cytochrome c reductase cytochrome b subunit